MGRESNEQQKKLENDPLFCDRRFHDRFGWLRRQAGGRGGGYLFSMNDLSGIDHLAGARDAGVVSLKIEGRLKSVEYVRSTVRAYRLALDAAIEQLERP